MSVWKSLSGNLLKNLSLEKTWETLKKKWFEANGLQTMPPVLCGSIKLHSIASRVGGYKEVCFKKYLKEVRQIRSTFVNYLIQQHVVWIVHLLLSLSS